MTCMISGVMIVECNTFVVFSCGRWVELTRYESVENSLYYFEKSVDGGRKFVLFCTKGEKLIVRFE